MVGRVDGVSTAYSMTQVVTAPGKSSVDSVMCPLVSNVLSVLKYFFIHIVFKGFRRWRCNGFSNYIYFSKVRVVKYAYIQLEKCLTLKIPLMAIYDLAFGDL